MREGIFEIVSLEDNGVWIVDWIDRGYSILGRNGRLLVC